MWKFVKEKKPGFVLNTVLPDTNMGEILHESQSTSTGGWTKAVHDDKFDHLKGVPPQWMVNVKDTARLQVAGLIDPDVENERILGFAEPFNWNDILACLRKIYPEKKFPEDIKDEPRDLSKPENSRGAALLKAFGRPRWTSLEESVRDARL